MLRLRERPRRLLGGPGERLQGFRIRGSGKPGRAHSSLSKTLDYVEAADAPHSPPRFTLTETSFSAVRNLTLSGLTAVLDLFDFLWKGFRTHFGAASEAGDDATRVKAAKQLHTKLRRKVERKLARPGHRFMVTKHQQLQRLRGLQRIKETGMYVDLRDDGTVGSPSDVDRRTAREYIQVVVGHRSNLTLLFGQVLLPDPSENFLAEVRNQVRPVLAAFTPEIGRMLSWLGDASKNNRRALSRAERERSIS